MSHQYKKLETFRCAMTRCLYQLFRTLLEAISTCTSGVQNRDGARSPVGLIPHYSKGGRGQVSAVPVRCGPVPLTSALWPPRRPHVPPACQYRLALRVAFVPRAPVAMRDAYPWQQGTTGEERVSRLKFSLSERLPLLLPVIMKSSAHLTILTMS